MHGNHFRENADLDSDRSRWVTCQGRKWAVGSVAHSGTETMFCANLIAQKAFGLARSGELKIAGFPKFEETICELKGLQTIQSPNYDVCVALSDGTLVIKQSVLDMWMEKHSEYSAECQELLKQHNSEFNPKNIKRGSEKAEGMAEIPHDLPNKQLCLQATLSKADFEKQSPDRLQS